AIHKEAQKNSILKYELQTSIDSVQNILFDRIRRLKLHDDYFEINNPASEDNINTFFKIMAQIDPELDKIYGQSTSERFCPSAMNIATNEEISENKTSKFINSKIRQIKLQFTLDSLCYTCGSQLLPEDHELSDQI
ncbi:13025_t:CDS:2, partial [Racocetra persica]